MRQREFEKEMKTESAPRRPIMVVLLLVLIAFVSPFPAVLGKGLIQVAGILGCSTVSVAAVIMPFLPKRFNFRIYDFLAIVFVLFFAASQTPSLIRVTPSFDEEVMEEKALKLSEGLLNYAQEHGVEGLAEFFIKQQDGKNVEVLSDNGAKRIYQVNTENYCYRLSILDASETQNPKFSFIALASPNTRARSFFMDAAGKIITLETE